MKKIAIVITPMCGIRNRKYGIRIEKRNGTWYKTWAFPFKNEINEYDESNSGQMDLSNLEQDDEFPGCPFCQSEDLIQCGACSNISCYGGEREFTCPWCGNVGEVTSGGWNNVAGGGY